MKTFFSGLFAVLLFGALSACSGDAGTGAVEVKWDRDSCERCRMVLSDHFYSAQIRGGHEDKKTKVYKFDDIGCAVLWLEQQPWNQDPRTEVWVNDYQTGDWIDARKAYYVTGRVTPMAYGLGAQLAFSEGAMDYAQAVAHIHEVEERFNTPEALGKPPSADTNNPLSHP